MDSPVQNVSPKQGTGQFKFAFILVTSLFFMWGFAHNLDPILIPHLKKSFTLTNTQSTLVDSAVYIAYFLLAVPAGLFLKRFGYKLGIVAGLLLFAAGCFLFIPAADFQSYPFFLFALFIIACGLATLETAANPYAAALGDPAKSTQRLNLAQSFNGLAAALAPLIGGAVIFTEGYSDEELVSMSAVARQTALAAEAESVKLPYFIIGVLLVLITLIFLRTKLPKLPQEIANENEAKTGQSLWPGLLRTIKVPELGWSVVAQFLYVGAQVSVFSLFLLYAEVAGPLPQNEATTYQFACGLAFLIGRFAGTFLMQYVQPALLLSIYAIINVLLSFAAIQLEGMKAIYSIVGICFFMSIMFPTIFALGIQKLGKDAQYGSSWLIMSIVGGAFLPLLFSYIGDENGDLRLGYWVPLVCFGAIGCYGFYMKKRSL